MGALLLKDNLIFMQRKAKGSHTKKESAEARRNAYYIKLCVSFRIFVPRLTYLVILFYYTAFELPPDSFKLSGLSEIMQSIIH